MHYVTPHICSATANFVPLDPAKNPCVCLDLNLRHRADADRRIVVWFGETPTH